MGWLTYKDSEVHAFHTAFEPQAKQVLAGLGLDRRDLDREIAGLLLGLSPSDPAVIRLADTCADDLDEFQRERLD